MNLTRALAVCLIAFGLAGVSVALGFIYLDFVRREGAWVDLHTLPRSAADEERQRILEAWRDPGRGWPALIAGTAGVAMLGAGLTIAIFELPPFRPRPAP